MPGLHHVIDPGSSISVTTSTMSESLNRNSDRRPKTPPAAPSLLAIKMNSLVVANRIASLGIDIREEPIKAITVVVLGGVDIITLDTTASLDDTDALSVWDLMALIARELDDRDAGLALAISEEFKLGEVLGGWGWGGEGRNSGQDGGEEREVEDHLEIEVV